MYNTLNDYLIDIYGEKVYKIALNAGFSCPNRNPETGTGGCIFCSEGGSGDFCPDSSMPIKKQIEQAKERLKNKKTGQRFIAYFQAYTNTYAPTEKLREVFFEAIQSEEIVAISIATRPDCLEDEVVSLLDELNKIKPVWIELGLQTVNENTAKYIKRGYPLSIFENAIKKLKAINVVIIAHIIIGLPNEHEKDILNTIKYVSQAQLDGVKLQLLHVLKNTELAEIYRNGEMFSMTIDEYISMLAKCVEHLSPKIIVHRLTGDGAKKDLIAPLWSGNKKMVLNKINAYFKDNNIIQGSKYKY